MFVGVESPGSVGGQRSNRAGFLRADQPHVIGLGTEWVMEVIGATSAHASRISRQIDGEVHAAGQSRSHPGRNRVVER